MGSFDKKFLTNESMENLVSVVVGTRPGIIMLAPIIHELKSRGVPYFVIHTGQHYSPHMDSDLFVDLELPKPEYHLKGVSDRTSHGGQTARILEGVEQALMERRPSLVLVGGDANTNLSAALAARKLRIKIGHVEAGERSFDWRMPEEHNRRIIDHISEYLFTTNEKGKLQLEKESVQGKIFVTGNTIVDASLNHAKIANTKSEVLNSLKVLPDKYILMTSHREENVDDKDNLQQIITGANDVAEASGLPILFLIHPRTEKRLDQFGLSQLLESLNGIRTIQGRRYLDFMQLLSNCKFVLTDSGGVQQEAFVHRKPCITLRDNTEWSETIECGGNRLAGANAKKILESYYEIVEEDAIKWGSVFGDGKASVKIVDIAVDSIGFGS
jgi:UDP-N-acetylglucosamine 2-epimerase (non-hydrolysing)